MNLASIDLGLMSNHLPKHEAIMSKLIITTITPAVKHTHINMALQQTQIADLYNQLIRKMGWEQPSMTSAQEQLNMIQQFQHIVQETQPHSPMDYSLTS